MKLKKILSLVVTLALVFSMVTISNVQAAEDRFSILKSLGINTDFSDNTTPITRYQLALVALDLTGNLPDGSGDPVYPDVPAKHKYFPVVDAVTKAGLMGAIADGSFAPDSNATPMDAGRMLLSELGYTAFAKQANWTAAQYNSKVQSLNLMKGVNAADGFTYSDVGQMIVNMLTTKVMDIISISDEGIVFGESTRTYIESKYGYVLRTGVLQANGKSSMTGYSTVAADQAVIDGLIYKTDGKSYTDYVGYSVKYVLTSEFADAQLIHAEKYQPSEEVVIQAEDIVNYDHYRLSYLDENGDLEVANFSSSSRVIINGQNMTTYDARYFTPDHGSITFVDTDGNEVYDVVNIEYLVYYKVGGASTEKLSDQWTFETLETKNFEYVGVFNDGIGAELMSFEQDAYAEIAPGAISFATINGNEMAKIDYVNSDVVTINLAPTTNISGKVTGKKANSLVMGDVTYDINPYYADLIACGIAKPIPLGAEITAVINEKGQIIDVPSIVTDYVSIADSLVYGYMYAMNPVSGMSKGAYIKLVDIYNLEELILKTSDDCKINGKEFDYAKVASVDPTTTSSSIYWPTGVFKHQLIKYALNGDGEISALYLYKDYASEYLLTDYIGFSGTLRNPDFDSAYMGYSTNDFTLDRVDIGMVADSRYLENLYTITPDHTIQLTIPPDPTDLNLWTVDLDSKEPDGDPQSFFIPFYDSTRRNDFEIYDVGEDYSIGVAIKRAAGGSGIGVDKNLSETSRSIIVTEVEDVYDEVYDEEKRQITGYQATPSGPRKTVLTATRDDLGSTTHYRNNRTGASTPSMLWTDIEVGDIIRVAKNDAGQVGGFALAVDKDYYTDLDNITFGSLSQDPTHANYMVFYMGYVTAVYGEVEGAMMNLEGANGTFNGLFKIGQPKPRAGGNSQPGAAMIWDLSSRTGSYATCADFKVGDVAIVHKSGGEIMEVFIIRP